MAEDERRRGRCTECGAALAGGSAECRAAMEELLARDFSDPTYFRVHRLLVDTYALQHPQRFCVSAKSLAAHLTGLCWLLEHDGSKAVGSRALGRWLNGNPGIEKPAIPEHRGEITIADVRGAANAKAHGEAVEHWARSTWEAYAPLHSLARSWVRQALAHRNGRSHRV